MATGIGTIYLRVTDLDRMTAFYQDIIGLQKQRTEGDTVYLGVGDNSPLLALTPTDVPRDKRRTTGLFHFALLVPTRVHLARSLQHLISTRTPLQGASDHIVSEAVYLADPEGNGIEIYRDRPREAWYKDGQFQLATLPLDADGVMGALNGHDPHFNGLPPGTLMGHIHLHVASLPESIAFYTGEMGMDVMMDVGSAGFLSYDGYHHHLGVNTWGGRIPPTPNAPGLAYFELHLDDAALKQSLTALADDSAMISDPAHNRLLLV